MRGARAALVALAGLALTACATKAEPVAWIDLFDGVSLGAWRSTVFGGEGEVHVEDGRLILDPGSPLTGVTWDRAFAQCDYELRVVAARVDGTDFFCGLTFPCAQGHCTLIVGGWGGGLVGLSCIDGADASDNDTTRTMRFDAGRDYEVTVRVTAERIGVRLDGVLIIDQPVSGRRVAVRPEVELSQPLGVASFATRASIATIAWRALKASSRPR